MTWRLRLKISTVKPGLASNNGKGMKIEKTNLIRSLAVSGLLFGSIAQASTPVAVESVKTSSDSIEEKSKGPWGFELGYSIKTDFAAEEEPRSYSHSMSGSVSYKLGNGWSTSGSLGFNYQSIGNKIITDVSTPSFSPSVGIRGGKTWKLGQALGGSHSLQAGVKTAMNFSENSRYEGVYAIPGASVGMTSEFFDAIYSLSNSVSRSYVINKYEFSPTDGTINTRNTYRYKMGHKVKLVGNLSAHIGFGFRYLQKLDDSTSYSYSNSQGLGYGLGNWKFSVSHQNGGFTRFGDVDFWYIDKYRRLVSASVSYSF